MGNPENRDANTQDEPEVEGHILRQPSEIAIRDPEILREPGRNDNAEENAEANRD